MRTILLTLGLLLCVPQLRAQQARVDLVKVPTSWAADSRLRHPPESSAGGVARWASSNPTRERIMPPITSASSPGR